MARAAGVTAVHARPPAQRGAEDYQRYEYSQPCEYSPGGKQGTVWRMENLKFADTPALLDAAKTRLGLTSDYKLAQALNWPFTTLSNYRTGRSSMRVDHLRHFCQKSGISIEDAVETTASELASKTETRRTVGRKAA